MLSFPNGDFQLQIDKNGSNGICAFLAIRLFTMIIDLSLPQVANGRSRRRVREVQRPVLAGYPPTYASEPVIHCEETGEASTSGK